jgi:DNA repair exonuclease SbcCD ATPase subunit
MFIIYHLADLHIKDTCRIELKHAINKVCDQINRDKIKYSDSLKICIVAGDIFHTKTKYTSLNTIDFFEIFDKLTKTCDYVITIQGNHDMNLNNNTSIDLIYPLINKYKNLYHFTETGNYIIQDIIINQISFNVISSADSFLNPIHPINYDTKYNFLILHETIDGLLCNNINLSGRIKYENLLKYDIVFMGHIHEANFINETAETAEKSKSKYNIAYSGSLIQQNIGESYIKGYIRWKIFDDKMIKRKFIAIPNDRGFIKININNSGIKTYNTHFNKSISNKYDMICRPKNPSKIVIEKETNENMNENAAIEEQNIISSYKKSAKDADIIVKNKIVIPEKSELTNINLNTDTSSIYLKEYMINNKFTETNINKILLLHNHYLDVFSKNSSIPSSASNYKWYISNLEWKNIFCFGDNIVNTINFQKQNIYGLIAENKHGKSAIIDIICYVLFDELIRSDIKDVINNNEKTGYIEITFYTSMNNSKYVIRKDLKRTAKTSSQKVKFFMNDIDKTDITPSETYKKIENITGNFKHFTSTALITQYRLNDFLTMANQERLIFLKDMLNLNVMENILENGKNKYKLLSSELNTIKTSFKTINMNDTFDINMLNDKIVDYLNENDIIEKKIIELNELIETTKNSNPIQYQVLPREEILEMKIQLDKFKVKHIEIINNDDVLTIFKENKEHLKNQLLSLYKPNENDFKIAATESHSIPINIPSINDMSINDMNINDMCKKIIHLQQSINSINLNNIEYSKFYINRLNDNDTEKSLLNNIQTTLQNISNCKYSKIYDTYTSFIEENKLVNLKKDAETWQLLSTIKYDEFYRNKINNFDTEDAYVLLEKIINITNDLETAKTKYKSEYEKYHVIVSKFSYEDIKYDIDTYKKIINLKEKLQSYKNVRNIQTIKTELSKYESIDNLKNKLINSNVIFTEFINSIKYNCDNVCEFCDENKQFIKKNININNIINGNESNKESIQSQINMINKLNDELEKAHHIKTINDEIIINLKNIKCGGSKHGITLAILEFIYLNYNDIKMNDKILTNIKLYESKLKEMPKKDVINYVIENMELESKYNEIKQKLIFPMTDYNTVKFIIKNEKNIIENEIEHETYKRLNTELNEYKLKLDAIKYKNYILYLIYLKTYIKRYLELEKEIHRVSDIIQYNELLKKYEESAKNKDLYDREKNKLEIYKSALSNKYDNEYKIKDNNVKINMLKDDITLMMKFNDIKYELDLLDLYIKCLDNKTGFPLTLLNKSCSKIEIIVNKFLDALQCNFSVKIDIERKLKMSVLKIYMVENSKMLNIDLASGYQKIIISMAFRHAFCLISNLPIMDNLIIDEGFAALDNKNLEILIDYIPSFKKIYSNLLFISHLDQIKLIIEKPIYIRRKNNVSYVI